MSFAHHLRIEREDTKSSPLQQDTFRLGARVTTTQDVRMVDGAFV